MKITTPVPQASHWAPLGLWLKRSFESAAVAFDEGHHGADQHHEDQYSRIAGALEDPQDAVHRIGQGAEGIQAAVCSESEEAVGEPDSRKERG
jgi:hypothetical protein